MRILLDECLPARLRRALPGHDVQTVQGRGWAGIKNGELLRRAVEERFDIIAWRAHSNDIVDLLPLMPAVLETLTHVVSGRVTRIPSEPAR